MSQIIDGMRSALENVGGSIGLTALFLAGLIALWYTKHNNKKEIGFLFWYALISLIVVIEPLYGVFADSILPGLVNHDVYLWIVPTIPVILYTGVHAVTMLENIAKKIVFVFGLLGILILAATTSYSQSNVQFGREYYDERCTDVLNYLCEDMERNEAEEILIWGDEMIMETARFVDGRICTVYGKDLWDAETAAITGKVYDENMNYGYWLINNIPGNEDEADEFACQYGCDYIVVDEDEYDEADTPIPETIGQYYLEYTDQDYLVYIRKDYSVK